MQRLQRLSGFGEKAEQQGFRLIRQTQVIPSDTIPLEHAELGIMPPAELAIAEYFSDFIAITDAACEQPLKGKLRRSA